MIGKFCFAVLAMFVFLSYGRADDAEANEDVKEATELYEAGEYYSAAKKYLSAELYADSIVLQANSVKHAAACFRKAEYLYKEFECLEKMLNNFPDHVNFQKAVHREFEIGNKYFEGHRDPAFTWFPWITGPDKTVEIYEKALGHGSFSKYAPQARLRLGRLYIEDGKLQKALKTFREIIKLYPGTDEQKYAYFELGNALMQMADRGDGDGRYGREAKDIFKVIIKKYPKDVEMPWAKRANDDVRQIMAKRLYGLGRFYYRNENRDAAERYLNEVVKKYYDTKVAYDSEALLAKIDKEFNPSGKKYKEKIFIKYKLEPLPEETDKLLVVPENSNGKWLLPITDLEIEEAKDSGIKKVEDKESEFEW